MKFLYLFLFILLLSSCSSHPHEECSCIAKTLQDSIEAVKQCRKDSIKKFNDQKGIQKTVTDTNIRHIISDEGESSADEVAGKFNIKIIVKLEGGDSTGITIDVSKDKKPIKIIKYEGIHYPLALDLNSYYLFKFSKKGFVTKAVYFNTKIPEGREKEDFARFIADIGLKKKTKDRSSDSINYVGGVKYNPVEEDFNKVND